jgi:hypothetical protein
MKPSKLAPIAIICVALGSTWTYTLLYDMDWYVVHVHSNVLMGIFIILALLMLFGGLMLILSRFE